MRIYDSATVKHDHITGFQSPASEFAAKPLSLDERYGVGNPALKMLRVTASSPALGIFKGDLVLVDLARKAGAKSLIVGMFSDELAVFKGAPPAYLEEGSFGVIVVLIREMV